MEKCIILCIYTARKDLFHLRFWGKKIDFNAKNSVKTALAVENSVDTVDNSHRFVYKKIIPKTCMQFAQKQF
jgi:hypothetical protein